MVHLARSLAVGTLALGLSFSSASGHVLAFATRTLAFESTSTTEVAVPLKDNGAKSLAFTTAANNQLVTITYNAECAVDAAPNSILSVRIFVDGIQAEPASPNEFHAFCSAIDGAGSVLAGGHWTGAARQSVIRVPVAGKHVVRVFASLASDGQGTWRIDDSSLVVETGVLAFATLSGGFSGTSTSEIALPLKDNGAKALSFQTTQKNARVRITFNAACRVVAPRGTWVSVRILVDGNEAEPDSGVDFALCTAVRASSDRIETNVLRQAVIRVPEPGKHVVRVLARLASSAPSEGLWELFRTSLVVNAEMLASAARTENFFSISRDGVQLPLNDNGASALRFTTTKNNQLVKITYNAECGVFGAPRGRSVNVRIFVDELETQPGPGFPDFRLCTAVDETGNTWVASTRQSLIRVPSAGQHAVRVFGALLNGAGAWSLDDSSLVVE